MIKNRLFIVFGIDHYNPLGVLRSLGENGINPVFICIPGRAPVASSSKYISKLHMVKDYMEGCKLLLDEYSNYPNDNLPIVITSDDEQVGYMDEHYDDFAGKFIFFNAGQNGRITEFMDKFNILELARKNGLKTLDAVAVERGTLPEGIEYPVITKSIAPNVGGWKSDVHICENEQELEEAFKSIESPTVLVQHYIDKKNEYCLDGFSFNKGKQTVIQIESTYNYIIKGYYSPFMTVKPFTNEKIRAALNKMLEEIGFEGIFSIEFLIDENDEYYFSEINFRNSTWSYASTLANCNLPLLWAQGMIDGCIPSDSKMIFKPFTAMVEPIDYQKRVVERNMDMKEWVNDLLDCKCPFYFNKNDMEPFFEMIRNNERLR